MLIRAVATVAALLALPYGCTQFYTFPPPRPFSGASVYNPYGGRHPNWLRANLHAHGVAWGGLTSGRQPAGRVVRRYRDLGYQIPGISNYQQITTTDTSTVPLYEHGFNIGKHHQIAIGAHRVTWFDFPLWQTSVHKQLVIDRVAATTDLVAIAHPTARFPYSPADLRRLTGYHFLEIANGQVVDEDSWDMALSAGRVVWALGNDDTHDISDPQRTAVAWTMIDAPSANPGDVIDALRAGRSYAVARRNNSASNIDTSLADVTLQGNALEVTIAGDPSTFLFIGQDGGQRGVVRNATRARYEFSREDTYVRTVIRSPRTWMFLNPILRYDGTALPAPAATAQVGITWIARGIVIGGIAAAVFRWRRRTALGAGLALALASPLQAQTPDRSRDASRSYERARLADLPVDNVFGLFESLEPIAIADRFSAGGLSASQPARLGGLLGSWSETAFRVGDADVSSFATAGTPLVYPDVLFWDRVTVRTSLAADLAGAGLSVDLQPVAPSRSWRRSISATTAHGALTPGPPSSSSAAPPIARLDTWDRLTVVGSGPLTRERLGATLGASFARGSEIDRDATAAAIGTRGSAAAHLVFSPDGGSQLRGLGWFERTDVPSTHRRPFRQPEATTTATSFHAQAAWERGAGPAGGWLITGALTTRHEGDAFERTDGPVFDRFIDGPLSAVPGIAARRLTHWSLRGRLDRQPHAAHRLRIGVLVEGARVESSGFFNGTALETIDGANARVWRFTSPGIESLRRRSGVLAHAVDEITLSDRVTLDVGLRLDATAGSAEGAAADVRWYSWLPHARLLWALSPSGRLSLRGSYTRAAYRLSSDLLSVGDPAAPVADLFRWSEPGPGPLVARAGPGSGGSADIAGLDPDLQRPIADELLVGFHARPHDRLHLRVVGIARWEHRLVGLQNTGAPLSAYTTFVVPDPGADVGQSDDDREIVVFDRRPETFGQDRYVLTSPAGNGSNGQGLEVAAEWESGSLWLLLGATASITSGQAGNRGFGPTENDQSVAGELFADPNAATLARGRLFSDRAFTGKIGVVYRFPADVRLGAIARYQDGQPFARVLVFPDLNQGRDAVRAFTNGESRFTFISTLDARLQKIVRSGPVEIAAFVDGFNLLNLASSVEENIAAAPNVRTSTAVQPPRAFHVGLGITF
jgi:hypothetical protein